MNTLYCSNSGLKHIGKGDSPKLSGLLLQVGDLRSCRMALLLLDLGTVRQEGPEVMGLLLPLSLKQRRAYVIHSVIVRVILNVSVENLSVYTTTLRLLVQARTDIYGIFKTVVGILQLKNTVNINTIRNNL